MSLKQNTPKAVLAIATVFTLAIAVLYSGHALAYTQANLDALVTNYKTNNTTSDLNKDGVVNVTDLSILLSGLGQSAPPPPPAAGGPFTNVPFPTDANVSKGDFIGNFATCDFAANGLGQDVPVTFQSGGTTYKGCYSVKKGGAAGSHPALFPNHGNFFLASTSADYNASNSASQNPISEALGDQWDIIVPAALQLVSPTNHANVTGYLISGNQIVVDYYKAIISDAKARQGLAAGRSYFTGFSAGSEVPLTAACYLTDVSAVVTMTGIMKGPASDTRNLGYSSCTKPAHSVSIMFAEATNPSTGFANGWLGRPNYTYNAHITPTHTALTASDITDILTVRPGTDWTNTVHAAEVWAYWQGCGNNLATQNSQSATLIGNPATFWNWTGCAPAADGIASEIQLYVISGYNWSFTQTGANHGVERAVIIDPSKPAWNFLKTH